MDFTLDFERPVSELENQIRELKQASNQNIDISHEIEALEAKVNQMLEEIYKKLSPWQRTQLSRHALRPHAIDYIENIVTEFHEVHGDRRFSDDPSMITGFGYIDGKKVAVIGIEKGRKTQEKIKRNFGMANPEGYRKALRLMKMAERFNFPVVTLIDTPGAYPGLEAEERGQAEAIARNLFEMAQLRVPIICVVIGEGASGGALGIGVGDRVYMLEYTWYSVISPESCSSILWHSWDYKEQAAEALKLTADDMHEFGLINGIIKEPVGGAHSSPEEMAKLLKRQIKKAIAEVQDMAPDERIEARINKYASMGVYDVVEDEVEEEK